MTADVAVTPPPAPDPDPPGTRTVRATAGTALEDHSALADDVRSALTARLADVELARVPRIQVHVASDRSTR